MNPEKLIDHAPSIHLDVECMGQKGEIWLSSIYGSYDFTATIEIPKGEIAGFHCPHCHGQMISRTECTSCGSFMVPFYLDMGGKVNICSRSGCKNHFVEFEDLSVALRRFYHEYGYSGLQSQPAGELQPIDPEEIKREETREIIETGTFLHTYCPHCRKSLIDGDMLKLKIRNDEEGILILSPYLNVFSSRSTVFLPEDRVVEELSCPHCDHSLIRRDRSCEKCGSPVAMIAVSARTKLIDFFICTKKGCRWHGLSENDLYEIRLESSMEW
jgi:ssDNA-binding Zn-finger/Zn-ribbon topoisomerase 1